jgi:four helix bundle protein
VSSKIEQVEDLIAWQKVGELTRATYRATQQGAFVRDLGLASRLERAAASMMSNIAEGFERRGRRQLHQFLSTAKGSCAEGRCHLCVAFDIGYLAKSDFRRLLAQAEEVGRSVGGLRASVEKLRDERGS